MAWETIVPPIVQNLPYTSLMLCTDFLDDRRLEGLRVLGGVRKVKGC